MISIITSNGLPLLAFEQLSTFAHLGHFVSTRQGGRSASPFDTLNLSYSVGDIQSSVARNREILTEAMGLSNEALYFPVQTHSTNVQRVDVHTSVSTLTNTDALICIEKNIGIAVMSADCVPVLFYDPVHHAIGAAYAGWRGTVGQIAVKTAQAMHEQFGTNYKDLRVGIGPSISSRNYEVGMDVIEQVEALAGKNNTLISSTNSLGKGFLDLWEANKQQLVQLGVQAQHIEVAGYCTFENDQLFFSARKSKNLTGRFAAGLTLR